MPRIAIAIFGGHEESGPTGYHPFDIRAGAFDLVTGYRPHRAADTIGRRPTRRAAAPRTRVHEDDLLALYSLVPDSRTI
jgi:hypothetical protein